MGLLLGSAHSLVLRRTAFWRNAREFCISAAQDLAEVVGQEIHFTELPVVLASHLKGMNVKPLSPAQIQAERLPWNRSRQKQGRADFRYRDGIL